MRWLGAAALVVLGCEPRVEEPLAKVPTVGRPQPSAMAAKAGSAGRSQRKSVAAAAPPRRCVRPMTKAAGRPMPPGGPAAGCPPDPGKAPPLGQGRVAFVDARVAIDVEIARDDAARARGLMFRKSLADDAGMLFIFERQRPRSFWMRNTCIGLDMIFVADDGVIVGIEENVPTLNDESYHVGCDARFVVEVNAGWCRRNGVRPGQRLQLP